jgi:hypothetical protein
MKTGERDAVALRQKERRWDGASVSEVLVADRISGDAQSTRYYTVPAAGVTSASGGTMGEWFSLIECP